jgi:hypothetical protein
MLFYTLIILLCFSQGVFSLKFLSSTRDILSNVFSKKGIASIGSCALLLSPTGPVYASSESSVSAVGNIPAAINAISNDIQSITCTLENQNVDDFHGSCQQLENIVRVRANKLWTIKQDWGSSASTGAAVWNGANMGIWYMENGVPKSSWKNAKVVELGAGIGFSGLVSHQLGATDVTITDGNIDVLKLADENIIQNIDSNRIKQVRTAQLRWGTDDEKNFINQESSPKSPDFILVSDCT